jgi:hypothetical protein
MVLPDGSDSVVLFRNGAFPDMSSAEFGKFMVSEAAKWMRVVKDAGIKGE